jgi:antitoxin MazE
VKLRVAKWGNSLAVRLPAEYTQVTGLKEGDSVDGEISVAGTITLIPAQPFNKAAFIKKMRRLRAGMAMTSATVETMRQDEPY